MKSFAVAFALLLLLAGDVLGQVKAVVTGPKTGAAGDLVVISARDSQGDNYRWIVPQRIQTIACGDGKDLAFATGRPGSYTFVLIVADKTAAIDYAMHTVVIGGVLPEPEKPDEPKPPEEPTPGDFEGLRKFSRESAATLTDKATATALATAIRAVDDQLESMCSSGRCPRLDEARAMMVAAIETALRRTPRSGAIAWGERWRAPINAELKKINSADVPTYRTAMRAVALGLAES